VPAQSEVKNSLPAVDFVSLAAVADAADKDEPVVVFADASFEILFAEDFDWVFGRMDSLVAWRRM